MRRIVFLAGSLVLGLASTSLAQGPEVTMSVAPPSGQAQTLTTHESGTATLTVSGVEYGFRPTMLDDQGTRTIVTIFKMPTADASTSVLGDVEVKLGAAPTASKTTPSFRIAVTKVEKAKPKM